MLMAETIPSTSLKEAAEAPKQIAVIILDGSLTSSVALKTIAMLSVTLGAKVPGIQGPEPLDASGTPHAGLFQAKLPILKAPAGTIAEIRRMALAKPDIFVADYPLPAQVSRNDEEYRRAIARIEGKSLQYLGVALFGEARKVIRLIGTLPAYRPDGAATATM